MIGKRIVDVVGSAILLIILFPVMALVYVAIGLSMGRPVIFRQRRLGLHGEDFEILKFRTMTDCVGSDGELLPDWERQTPLGNLLRQTSIDELPQLVNVLRGEMSLVGPRPLLDEFVQGCDDRQLRRFEMRPGITGSAQINGRKSLDYARRFEWDVWYVDNWSILLDMKLMLKTLPVVCCGAGTDETGITLSASPEPDSASEPARREAVTVGAPDLGHGQAELQESAAAGVLAASAGGEHQ